MHTELRKTTRSTALVVVLRIALVAIAAGAVVAALVVGRGGAGSDARRYACPMHGEVSSPRPGDCPICGMALEPVDRAGRAALPAAPSTGGDAIALSALRASPESATLLRFSVAQARRNVNPGEVFAPAIAGPDGAITARLYRDELATLADDERAELIPAAAPGAPIAVRRAAGTPVVHATLADVEFRAEPGAAPPAAGEVGWIKLAHRSRDMLVVRASSIIQSSDGPYVLVFSSQSGTVTRRKIEIGKEFMGMTAIMAGLRDKEFVIMANAFSFDAERRLQAGP
jgi:hypothetical protein